jgi:hypothetical protein
MTSSSNRSLPVRLLQRLLQELGCDLCYHKYKRCSTIVQLQIFVSGDRTTVGHLLRIKTFSSHIGIGTIAFVDATRGTHELHCLSPTRPIYLPKCTDN